MDDNTKCQKDKMLLKAVAIKTAFFEYTLHKTMLKNNWILHFSSITTIQQTYIDATNWKSRKPWLGSWVTNSFGFEFGRIGDLPTFI